MTSDAQEAGGKPRDHFCPGCGKQLRYGPRNPWYFCGNCIATATDARGHPISFIGMGAEWCYSDGHGPDAHDSKATAILCLISGRPVIVHEARQGGQVAEPVYLPHLPSHRPASANPIDQARAAKTVDLTDAGTLDRVVAERLVTPGRKVRY